MNDALRVSMTAVRESMTAVRESMPVVRESMTMTIEMLQGEMLLGRNVTSGVRWFVAGEMSQGEIPYSPGCLMCFLAIFRGYVTYLGYFQGKLDYFGLFCNFLGIFLIIGSWQHWSHKPWHLFAAYFIDIFWNGSLLKMAKKSHE